MLRRLPIGSTAPSQGLTKLQGHEGDGATISVGRSQDSDIVLEDELFPLLISRNHATLKRTGRALFLLDTGSTNGSFVNEERVRRNEARMVSEGDIISFGGPRRVLHTSTGAPVEHPNPFMFQLMDCNQLFDAAVQRPTQEHSLWDHLPIPVEDVVLPSLRRTDSWAGSTGRQHVRRQQQVHIDLTLEDDDVDEVPVRLKRRHSKKRERSPLEQPTPVDLEALEDKAEAPAAAAGAGQAKSMMEKMEEQFECQICREFMVATHSMVPCGHMACAECLGDWLLKKPNCPSCRAPATAAPVPSLKVDNLLTDFVEPMLSAEDKAERSRRKAAWEKRAPKLNGQLKNLFARPGAHAAQAAIAQLHAHMGAPPPLPPGMPMDQLLGQFLMMRGRSTPMSTAEMRARRGRGRYWGGPQEAMPQQIQLQMPPPPPLSHRGYTVDYFPRRTTGTCNACQGALLSNQLAVCRPNARQPSNTTWYHLHCRAQIPGFMSMWNGNNGNLPGMAALTPSEQARVRNMVNGP